MKWIFALLIFISATAIGQTEDSTKYIWYKFQYGSRMPRFWSDSALKHPYGDTALFAKPQKPGFSMMHTDKQMYRWDGTGWRLMGSGSTTRFGIEDTTGIQDRYMNMQGHDFIIDSSSDILLTGIAGGHTSSLNLSTIARLRGYDGVNQTDLSAYPGMVSITTNASNIPGKLLVNATDSLKIASPSSIAAWKNDTLKAISISDLTALVGGGTPSGPAGGDLTGTYPNPTIGTNKVGNSKFRQSAGLSVVGVTGSSTANVADITASTDSTVLARFGTALTFRKLDSTIIAKTPVAPGGSCTLCNLNIGPDGRVYAMSNGSVGGIPTWDATAGAGGTVYNKDLFLIRTSGGQARFDIIQLDTSNTNAVARINIIANGAKAVACLQTDWYHATEWQNFWYLVHPGTHIIYDSVKSWVLRVVPYNDPDTSYWLGQQFVDAYHGNLKPLSMDTVGRIGFTGFTGSTKPRAWINVNSGTYPAINIKPQGTPTDPSAGDIDVTATNIFWRGLDGTPHYLADQTSNLDDGTYTGGSPDYEFHPSATFASDSYTGLMRTPTLHTLTATTKIASQATLSFFNSDVTGWPGFEIRDTRFNQQAAMFVDNADNTKLWTLTRAGKSINWQAGSSDFTSRTAQMTLSTTGNLLITNLQTGSTAPTTSGTKKMVVTDANGQLSFDNIPSGGSGITSINGETGSSQTIAAGTGINVATTTNTQTISIPTSFITTGTYTPTLTNGINVTSTTAYQCKYIRVGDMVTVSGKIFVDFTTTGATEVGISLPISSDIANDYDLTGNSSSGFNPGAAIYGDATNNRASFNITTSSSAGYDYYFTFMYQVL